MYWISNITHCSLVTEMFVLWILVDAHISVRTLGTITNMWVLGLQTCGSV